MGAQLPVDGEARVAREIPTPDLVDAGRLRAWTNGNHLLIVERKVDEVWTVDLNSGDAIQLGQKGEGPGELKSSPSLANYLVPLKDSLLIVSADKAIQYSKNGNIIKEFKVPFLTNYLYPLKDNYLGLRLRTGQERSRKKIP